MNNRVTWIDSAKALGIILVIYGHISFVPEFWNVWLYSFHMPLFFFLAGITLKREKTREFKPFFINKVKTLIVPYLMFATALWLWDTVALIPSAIRSSSLPIIHIAKGFIGIFLQIRTTAYGPGAWFIPCIFLTFILFCFVTRVAKENKKIMLLLASISLVCGYLYCTYRYKASVGA